MIPIGVWKPYASWKTSFSFIGPFVPYCWVWKPSAHERRLFSPLSEPVDPYFCWLLGLFPVMETLGAWKTPFLILGLFDPYLGMGTLCVMEDVLSLYRSIDLWLPEILLVLSCSIGLGAALLVLLWTLCSPSPQDCTTITLWGRHGLIFHPRGITWQFSFPFSQNYLLLSLTPIFQFHITSTIIPNVFVIRFTCNSFDY